MGFYRPSYVGRSETTSGYSSPSSVSGGPTSWTSVTDAFNKALESLTEGLGPKSQLFQQSKRKTLSDIAMNSVQTGMANTLNMPAASIAYDKQVLPGLQAQQADATSGLYSQLAQMISGYLGQSRSLDMQGQQLSQQKYLSGQSNDAQLANTAMQLQAQYDREYRERQALQFPNLYGNNTAYNIYKSYT